MQYGGCTDVSTYVCMHNKIVPLYMLVWGSLRLAPIKMEWEALVPWTTKCVLHLPGCMEMLDPQQSWLSS